MSGAPALLMNARRDTTATASARENASESRRSSAGSRLSRDYARPGIEARIELDGCSLLRRRLTIWFGCGTWRKLPPEASNGARLRAPPFERPRNPSQNTNEGKGIKPSVWSFPQPARDEVGPSEISLSIH